MNLTVLVMIMAWNIARAKLVFYLQVDEVILTEAIMIFYKSRNEKIHRLSQL